MTLYLNLRHARVGGFVRPDPQLMQGDTAALIGGSAESLVALSNADAAAVVAGRNLLFFVHGFNVDQANGAVAFARLEPALQMQAGDIAIGVLWPGDGWLPYINYVVEGDVAVSAGKALASFYRTQLAGARSYSFASHSLGARVVLQALLGMLVPARCVTLTAGAIDQNCLIAEYAKAARATTTLSMLASKGDDVLKLAFPLADPFVDLLNPDHTAFQPALGYAGPSQAEAALVEGPWQIPYDPNGNTNMGHGDYNPSGDPVAPPVQGPQAWRNVAAYLSNVFYERPQSWPPLPTATGRPQSWYPT